MENIEVVLDEVKEKVKHNKKDAWNRWGKGFILYVISHIPGQKILDKDKISKAFKLADEYSSMWCDPNDRERYSERLNHIAKILKNQKSEAIKNPDMGFLAGFRKTGKGKPIPPDLITLFGVLYCHLVYFFGEEKQALKELQRLWDAIAYKNTDDIKGDIRKNLERSPYRDDYLEEYNFWIGHYVGYHVSSDPSKPKYFHSGISVQDIKTSEEARKRWNEWYEQIGEDFKDFKRWYKEQKN
jgi:hypothetical protein